MKRLVLGAVVVGLLGFGAPMASAADRYAGGCGFNSVRNPETGSPVDEFTGVLYVAIAAVDSTTAAPLPIEGECWLRIDGVVQEDTVLEFSGTGAAAGAKDIAFTAHADQIVELCQSFSYGSTTETDCGLDDPPFPPSVIGDLVDYLCSVSDCGAGLIELVLTLAEAADPLVCPVLVELGLALDGGIDGVLEIDAEGDVWVLDLFVWDCPPYES